MKYKPRITILSRFKSWLSEAVWIFSRPPVTEVEWMEEQIDREVRSSTRKTGGADYTTMEFLLAFYGMSPKDKHAAFHPYWHPGWWKIPQGRREMLVRNCVKRFIKSGRFRVTYDRLFPTQMQIRAAGLLDTLAGL